MRKGWTPAAPKPDCRHEKCCDGVAGESPAERLAGEALEPGERAECEQEHERQLDREVEPELPWAIVDSNHGPPPYQSGALTN
jgi:hypothetical protein